MYREAVGKGGGDVSIVHFGFAGCQLSLPSDARCIVLSNLPKMYFGVDACFDLSSRQIGIQAIHGIRWLLRSL